MELTTALTSKRWRGTTNNTEPPSQPTVATDPRLYWVLVGLLWIGFIISLIQSFPVLLPIFLGFLLMAGWMVWHRRKNVAKQRKEEEKRRLERESHSQEWSIYL